ncbi:MBL fold metallo-hydrolase [Brevibacillus dissolubilis]|uniref:MBL fold metallo-hydrolase n=1 Tax=Brevibacillus dissolubilis TaxID=1844116 RepID=UPI001117759A|nr:MBL fold metallo-hydrolase [Brevibacillus dissolubilis]
MRIKRLTWAGLYVQSGNTAVLIDPLASPTSFFVPTEEAFLPLQPLGQVDAVLLTHTHLDHFDAESLRNAYGTEIPIYVPEDSVREVLQAGFTKVIGVRVGESYPLGDLSAIVADSVDGFGFPQVAWIVSDGTHKLIHTGDTLWHGYWWKIKRLYGPIHYAFLPVNGPMLEVNGVTPSHQPAAMTPEQAVSAAHLLAVEQFIPIHYQTFHSPPLYAETADVLGRLQQASRELDVHLHIVPPGEWVS